MIFKVFYQKNFTEVPVRENTSAMFVEAESEREVRKKLADKGINIEFIQLVSEDLLAFEKSKEDFKVESL
ncbi:DNA-dependent RNA polymerase subunit epsilon [Bacillus piscicola]|uniref:DNA-dependent RNA polymerase subunit epsilon n=1 Tax=Bacillus piscicola TaxID=1632684 RepID=UPI001F08D0AF|nr:DNA-directed RNA polymerase subunit epsilon [Bacillus piscicola]